MRKGISKALSPAQSAELDALAMLPDDRINTAALPEQRDWSGARRGVFFQPAPQQLAVHLDADLIDWFKGHGSDGEGYQTLINRALRQYVSQHGGAD